ncbi:elongation factor 1-alpha C-terminal domain-related protein, partial [Salinicola avicenniae]|uniref:elongation factor 1-alpha C-terminal domain-related protein n=1 Tax=Salinicola avicenniae TaxID=2916836 RepID=UPI0040418D1B
DLVDYSEARFNEIVAEYREFAEKLDAKDIRFVPMSALEGDNVVNRSEHLSWYVVDGQPGPALLELLETVEVAHDSNLSDLRLPVQNVNRPNLDFRGYCGTLEAGILRPGQTVKALPSGKQSTVERIVTYDGDLEEAYPGQAITVTLTDEIDISRGDWLVAADAEVAQSSALEADIVWMHDTALEPGRLYDFKLATREVSGRISVDYQIDVNTLEHLPVEDQDSGTLPLNAIGRCRVELTASVPLDDYRKSPGTGAFIVIDRLTNVTVGAGLIRGAADGSVTDGEVDWQAFEIEFNALIRKHFPHWEAKDVRTLLKG